MDVQTLFGSFPALPLPAAARTVLCSGSAALVLTSLSSLFEHLSASAVLICTQGVPRASDPKHLSPFCSFLLFNAFGYDRIGKSDSILCA